MNIQYLLVLLFACAAGGMTYVLAGEPFRKPLARARMSIAARKGMHAKPTQRMKIAEAIDRAGEAFEKVIPLKLSESRELQDKLDLAGLKITPSTWRAISLGITIFTAIMLAGAALVGGYGISMALLVGIIGAIGGWAVCGVWLSHAGKTRGEEIDRYLPPALELLTISVSAGVLVERGFRQLAENKALGPLADEFARTDMGSSSSFPRSSFQPQACSWKSCNREHQLNDMKQPGCRFAPRLLSFFPHNPGHTGNFLQSAAL